MVRGGLWIVTVVLFASHLNLAASANEPKAISISQVCLNGSYNKEGKCVCKSGFSEYQGNCFPTIVPSSCPPGSIMWNGSCQTQNIPPMQEVVPVQETYVVVPPLRVTLPIPELSDPLDPTNTEKPSPDDDDSEDVDEDPEYTPPIRDEGFNRTSQQTVNNHNIVHNGTVQNTNNVNNVILTITRNKLNGAIRTVVIRNNETTVHEEKPPEKPTKKPVAAGGKNGTTSRPTTTTTTTAATTTELPSVENLPCCTIVSPRVCQKQADEWVCFHRKQYVCSKACTAKVMYLRPRKPRYANHRTPLDCSGCARGRSRCHPMCYTYDCMQNGNCSFIDQELIGKEKTKKACVLLDEHTVSLQTAQNQPTSTPE